MHLSIVTLFPDEVTAMLGFGVTGRAIERGLLRLSCVNPRDFTHDRHRTVDDRPYGGGPGMVLKAEPLLAALAQARVLAGAGAAVAHLSPQGRVLEQDAVRELAARPALVLLAGRYEGIDERVVQAAVDEEWSIGDYVLSGGELAAAVLADAMARLLPGALGDAESAGQDSFMEGLLDCPHYTRPEVLEGRAVPAVLLSGNHEAIRRWRLKQALGRTWRRRPDLLERLVFTSEQQRLLAEYQAGNED
jgi:tRNA (guanine37-N1)-methyltransferase